MDIDAERVVCCEIDGVDGGQDHIQPAGLEPELVLANPTLNGQSTAENLQTDVKQRASSPRFKCQQREGR
eukprot:2430060-Rhodomonas_salina.4